MEKEKIRNITSEIKNELHKGVNCKFGGFWEGESGRSIKPLKDRCQTMRNHTQKMEHFREEKNI